MSDVDFPNPLGDVLDEIRIFIRRFVALDDHQAVALTLWAAHTHVFDAFDITPYISISSPEKRSGKTRCLEVLKPLVRAPLPTVNISDAALFRVIADRTPTLLIDEVDAIFGKGSAPREELRGILNAGYCRGAETHRMGGANKTTLESFPVFCPKVFTGIGDALPDTLVDRSIPIRLKRQNRTEGVVERFRLRETPPIGAALRDELVNLLEPHLDFLAASRPDLPDELDDRAQDVWEPLLAVADLAGDHWAEDARAAAIALSMGEERGDDSITARLVGDIAFAFTSTGNERMRTSDLLAELYKIEESPWGDWYGKPLSAQGLSRLLKPYRIKTMPVWVDGETLRGYKLEQFSDAFAQLGVSGVRSVRSLSAPALAPNAPNAPNADHASNPLLDGWNGTPSQVELNGRSEGWAAQSALTDEQGRCVRHQDTPQSWCLECKAIAS